MRSYIIQSSPDPHKIHGPSERLSHFISQPGPAAKIDNYIWSDNGYQPQAWARLGWTTQGLLLHLTTLESQPRAIYREHNNPVFEDSCLEFFLQPAPETNETYINFEFNANGALLLGFGKNRHNRQQIGGQLISQLVIATSQTAGTEAAWSVSCAIPLDLLTYLFGPLSWQKGWAMRGNFYKCGDCTAFPHYGCWNLIEARQPDFHRSEYFGSLILG